MTDYAPTVRAKRGVRRTNADKTARNELQAAAAKQRALDAAYRARRRAAADAAADAISANVKAATDRRVQQIDAAEALERIRERDQRFGVVYEPSGDLQAQAARARVRKRATKGWTR
jgi:hypothetical protein